MFKAEVIADSINDAEVRITTFQVTMHRFVLAEFNTHRMLSRNFRSSRAVPFDKLIEEVRLHPAMPVTWQKNIAGMQGGEELEDDEASSACHHWLDGAYEAAKRAQKLASTGLHKSWVNRVLEPFLYVHGVVTATEWQNFYGLRCHEDAQPEIRALADAMFEAQKASVPSYKSDGDWHLPYITAEDWPAIQQWLIDTDDKVTWGIDVAKKISTARCARVSYKAHDGTASPIEKDLELYEKLVGSQPIHASPAEHQAMADKRRRFDAHWGNFRFWKQHRKELPEEHRAPFDMSPISYRVIEGKVYKCVSK